MGELKSEILQGTLDLMVLKALEALGPQHDYGIARRIEQISEDLLSVNEGTVCASLLRLQQRRWISAKWGTSENNRKPSSIPSPAPGKNSLQQRSIAGSTSPE